MLDKTVLDKMVQDERAVKGIGYFSAVRVLPPKIGRALDGIVLARANELCWRYEDLFQYVMSEQSEQLCRSAMNGISRIDYTKLPQSK